MRSHSVSYCAGAGFLLVSTLVSPTYASTIVSQVHEIGIENTYKPQNFSFLDSVLRGKEIVQLGESIHVTKELPLVRLHFVKYLHQELGFDVLTLEGSAIEAWLAMDGLYNSRKQNETERAQDAQEKAWFGLWQTESMLELMKYIDSTIDHAKPLYLSSFDVQPGNSRKFHGNKPFKQLFEAVSHYSKSPLLDRDRMAAVFDNLVAIGRAPNERCTDKNWLHEASSYVNEFERWVATTVTEVAKETTQYHANALMLLPDNIRDRIDLCSYVANNSEAHSYQIRRDQLSAENVLMLKDRLSSVKKVITWGHHSHLHYNATHENINSMGEHLKETLGDRIYTIGTFVGSGRILGVDDDELFPVFEINVEPRAIGEIEAALASIGPNAFFLDLNQIADEELATLGWAKPSTMVFEGLDKRPTIFSKDFDGAIYIGKVSPQTLRFLDKSFLRVISRLNGIYVSHKVWVLGLAGSLLLAFTLFLVRFICCRVRP
ncbi:MAG: erythromycin esterase family protein [Oligoflexales bacterium]